MCWKSYPYCAFSLPVALYGISMMDAPLNRLLTLFDVFLRSINIYYVKILLPLCRTLPTSPKLHSAPVITVSTLSNGLQVVSRKTQANVSSYI